MGEIRNTYKSIRINVIRNNERLSKMKKERYITIKVIEKNKINKNRLAEFFARKYSEKNIKEKS